MVLWHRQRPLSASDVVGYLPLYRPDAIAKEGSVKNRFGDILNLVFERMAGIQPGISSTTNIFFKSSRYSLTVWREILISSTFCSTLASPSISAESVVELTVVELLRARTARNLRNLCGFRLLLLSPNSSFLTMAFKYQNEKPRRMKGFRYNEDGFRPYSIFARPFREAFR